MEGKLKILESPCAASQSEPCGKPAIGLVEEERESG
jgi:hypothetical protein